MALPPNTVCKKSHCVSQAACESLMIIGYLGDDFCVHGDAMTWAHSLNYRPVAPFTNMV